jgi:hypothetical protein
MKIVDVNDPDCAINVNVSPAPPDAMLSMFHFMCHHFLE